MDNASHALVEDSCEYLKNAGFPDAEIGSFREASVSVLNDYAEFLGEGSKIEYHIRKRFSGVEIRVVIFGERYDPCFLFLFHE